MKNNFEKNLLFACPIYKFRIDPNSYDKEKIINDILYNKSLKNTRNDPHQKIGKIIINVGQSLDYPILIPMARTYGPYW